MKVALFIALVLASVAISAYSKTAEEWKTRTIYQVLTDRFAREDGSTADCHDLGAYCGGTYKGILKNLDYIKGMGFNAIWLSPIIKNREGGYHGYWGTDLYSLNERFGSEQDLVNLIRECQKNDIWVMIDVVANHMGPTDQNYNGIKPFDKAEHYHDYCIISSEDFNTHNQRNIENCRLAGLADLKQESPYVETTLLNWISNLVKKYNIDGLRIDTVPEVPKWFWSKFT
jgi:alpha-amylase